MQISDAESQYVRRSDCDTLFIVANYQPDKKDASVAVNDEHALMRFEFLEAVVRLAAAKYGKVCSHLSPASTKHRSNKYLCLAQLTKRAICTTQVQPKLWKLFTCSALPFAV